MTLSATLSLQTKLQTVNKEILLVCLRYVYFCNGAAAVRETFFDSVHVKGRATGQTIGNHILEVLKKHNNQFWMS